MKKRRYPILEFDEDRDALISPEYLKNQYPSLPKRLVITFFKDAINALLSEGRIELFYVLHGENDVEIFKYINEDAIIIHGKLGSPAMGGYTEDLIALGVEKIMFCGGGGTLNKEFTVGKFIVVNEAIRDEGFSYHYIKPSRTIKANRTIVKKIEKYLSENNLDYVTGKVWTTDAFFRETKEKIRIRKEEGALLVEMEQAALLAVSKYREIEYGAIIYAGDDVSGTKWDGRRWKSRTDIRRGLTDICLEIVKIM